MTNTTRNDLEVRISKALRSGTAAQISALIAAAERAAATAAANAEKARARALDPLLDPGKVMEARKEAEDARFTADRMTAAAKRLREAHSRAETSEAEARRWEAYEEGKAARDAAATVLAERYGPLADELAGLLEAVAAADKYVAQANASLPSDAVRLEPVEIVARPGAGPNTKPLTKIALPAWRADDPPLWGRSDKLGDGDRFMRTRPVDYETIGNDPEEAA